MPVSDTIFSRTQYLCSFVDDLLNVIHNEDATVKLQSLRDTIAHSAPEILNTRLKTLYDILVTHCENNTHAKILYTERLMEYYDMTSKGDN